MKNRITKNRYIGFVMGMLFISGALFAQENIADILAAEDTNVKADTNIADVYHPDINYNPVEDGYKEPYHFGIWVNYEQQFGVLDNKFITIGGPSLGFNLGKHFLLGAGVYSTFGNRPSNDGHTENAMLYGGGIVGIRWNPQHPVVFRTQVLLGAAAFDSYSVNANVPITDRSISFIVVPEVALDIKIAQFFHLTLAANYRYIENPGGAFKNMKGLGALSGVASLGFSF